MIAFGTDKERVQMYVDNKMVVDTDLLNRVWKKDTILNIYNYCNSYTDDGYTKIIDLTHEKTTDKLTSPSVGGTASQVCNILEAMSRRDRQIYVSLINGDDIKQLCVLKHILRYDITIVKKHLEFILNSGYEDTIIILLHISDRYRYLLEYVDVETVMACSNYLPRMWFYNNVLVPKLCEESHVQTASFCWFKNADRYIYKADADRNRDYDVETGLADQAVTRSEPLGLQDTRILDDKYSGFRSQYNLNIKTAQEKSMNRIMKNKNEH
jgi:hypothetical protein